jgi:hydroxymethylpyrimidine/phosphomethylpyrimidine kinase
VQEILPRASVLTPNLPEARALVGCELAHLGARTLKGAPPSGAHPEGGTGRQAGRPSADEDVEAETLARAVLALGPRVVVLTGGHRARAVDLFLDSAGEGSAVSIEGERHPDGAAHGSGCTHSAVLAAQLALGRTPLDAARAARALAGAAVANGLRDVGQGTGPVDVLDLARMRAG